jgi:hypothetical protein
MEQKVPPQRHWKPVSPTFLLQVRHRLLGGFGGCSCAASACFVAYYSFGSGGGGRIV